MSPDITSSTITYVKTNDDVGRSTRRSTAAGLNIPKVLTVSHQAAKDKTTGEGKTRSMVRLDWTVANADGTKSVDSAYLVLEVPASSTTARMTAVEAALIALMGETGFLTSVLNQEI